MNRAESTRALKAALTPSVTQPQSQLRAVQQVLKEMGGISADETAGSRDFLKESGWLDAGVRSQFSAYLSDADAQRPYIKQHNARISADQPRLNAAMTAGLREGAPTKNLDGEGTLPEAFKTLVREGLESKQIEAFDPRFLRDNPIFEDNAAVVGDTQGKGAIISTGVTNPYGGQESKNRDTLSYANALITPEKVTRYMTTERLLTVDTSEREADGKTHKTVQKQLKWDGSLSDTYFEGDRMPSKTVGPNGAPWSGHYMLTTSGLLALPYTRQSASERVFLTTSSLYHENPTYKVLAVGHFQMRNGEISSVGLSGRMAKGMRNGDFKIVDVVAALKALGLKVASNVTLQMEG